MARSRTMQFLMIVALVVVATVMTLCSPTEDRGRPAAAPLRISGAEVALPLVRAMADSIASSRPSIRFRFLAPATTAGGVAALAAGELDIAAISRPLSREERASGVREVVLAFDPLVLVCHPQAGVTNLSTRQVRDIYSGAVRNWRQVGGGDLQIAVVDRPEDSSGKLAFREHIAGEDLIVTPEAIVVGAADEVEKAVLSTPGAIAYTSLGLVLRGSGGLTPLTLDGVVPNDETVLSGAYRAVRTFGVAVREERDDRVDEFLSFATSPSGGAVARSLRMIPR